MSQFSSKEPWEMTEEEWNAERERIRASSSGEHRKSLYPCSENGGKQWQAHFEWLTMNLPPQWRRFRGDEPYRSSVPPKPEDEDYDVAFQIPISHAMILKEKENENAIL